MSRRTQTKPPWWQIPRIWAGWVAGIGAGAVAITVVAGYIDLPSRVNEVEASDVEQDKILDRITTIMEMQQQTQQAPNQYYRQAPQPPQKMKRQRQQQMYYEEDYKGYGWCCDEYECIPYDPRLCNG